MVHRRPKCTAAAGAAPTNAGLWRYHVHARLVRSQSGIETGYAAADLDAWSTRAREWLQGGEPDDLLHMQSVRPARAPRDVFFFISSAKARNPAASIALLKRLGAIK